MTKPLVRLPRSALSGAFFVIYGLLALPFAVLLPFISRRAGRLSVRFLYRLFVFLARITGLYTVRFDPPPPAPDGRGRVVVMNHVSLIDICVLLANLPDSICIAKASAKRNPFHSVVVNRLMISNDSGGEKTVADAVRHIEEGVNVVVFPQGTRGGESLRRGAARIALAARCDVVAYRISYDPVVLAKGQPWWDVGDKIIRISVELRGTLRAERPNDRPAAVAMTDEIRRLIMGDGGGK